MRRSGKAIFPPNVRYGDIVSGLPLAPASAHGVFCSHVLEHLDRSSVAIALQNTFVMLSPGGTFRLVVPDLVWRAQSLIADSEAGRADAADRFMRASYLGEEAPARTVADRLRAAYGNSSHRWMYDYGLMARLLGEAGFVHIRRCSFGDYSDSMFKLVEDEGRFFDSGHAELAIEAEHP